jgi:hypothetical protein
VTSRLIPSDADIRACWRNVAKLRTAAGDRAGAKHARWVAANWRTAYPTKRPELM